MGTARNRHMFAADHSSGSEQIADPSGGNSGCADELDCGPKSGRIGYGRSMRSRSRIRTVKSTGQSRIFDEGTVAGLSIMPVLLAWGGSALLRNRLSVLMIVAAGLPLSAEREPVLKQIDLPHAYYYREMYVPQLTTGPSSVAWLPDSRSLVYSMAGSLWRQKLGSSIAEQLTAGAGYDYQPD